MIAPDRPNRFALVPLDTPLGTIRFSYRSSDQEVRVRTVPLIPRAYIERKASQIIDPVERLRYLRRRAGILQPRLQPAFSRRKRRLPILGGALLLVCLLIPGYRVGHQASPVTAGVSLLSPTHISPVRADVFPDVWLVDKTSDFETYSNGLRIDDRFTVAQSEAPVLPGLPTWLRHRRY